jgi:hypothetical protein
MWQKLKALPPYLGGKRKLLGRISGSVGAFFTGLLKQELAAMEGGV